MSFSYKTLSSNDITLTSYIANKQWEVTNTTLSQNGVSIYIGENLPLSRTYPFDPTNDLKTSHAEYRRLVFDSIKHLYYENYTSGSLNGEFFHSSSYFNYEQNTLASGSSVSTFRRLSTITGSNSLITPNPDRGGKVVIISVDQNIFGSGLNPNSVFISGSGYYLRDDGEGNLYNWRNEDNYAKYSTAIYNQDIYLGLIDTTLQLEYVGNVFYSHGLIVITDEDYLCVFGAPPGAVNDYFSYLNINIPTPLDILGNDICDCGTLNLTSFSTSSIEGYTFPNYTYDNGFITITPDQTSVIPGDYKLGYIVNNSSGLPSNTGSVNLTITSKPLVIENIITPSICYGDTSILPVTFSINYGVPYYSYSLDNGTTYTGVNTLFNVTVSGSMTASLNNTIYVKDYLDNITTSSFSSWYPSIQYLPTIVKNPCNTLSNDGIIRITTPPTTSSITLETTLDPNDRWYDLSYISPKIFTGLTTGSYTVYVRDQNNCISSSIITLTPYTPLTASVTMSYVNCYSNPTGQININLSNIIDNLYLDFIDPTGSYVFDNIPLTSSVLVFPNLTTGSWTASLHTTDFYGCQNYYNTFIITGSTPITFSTTASYISSCSNSIIFNATGGLGNYTYYVQNSSTNQTFSSVSPTASIFSLDGGIFNTYIIDGGSCFSNIQTQEVFGRKYIYSGSYCEI